MSELPEAFVGGQLLPDPRHVARPHEAGTALALMGIAQLVERSVLLGFVRVRTGTAGLPTHRVLARQTARTHRPEAD